MEKNNRNYEVADLSKLRVNKATADDIKRMKQGEGFTIGCDIGFTWWVGNSRGAYFLPTHPIVEELISKGKCEPLYEAAIKYDNNLSCKVLAESMNWSVQCLMDKLRWEYVDFGNYWSINPGTYFRRPIPLNYGKFV